MIENYKIELDFALEPPHSDLKISNEEEYRLSKKLRSVNYSEFINVQREDVVNPKHYVRNQITTKVKTMFGDKYLAAVDCDGESAKEIAVYNLTERGIDHCVIISSYDSLSTQHYWIICSYAGNITDTLGFMKNVPGNDQRYVDCCINKQEINLRAYPKNCSVPVFYSLDHLSDTGSFPVLRDWVNNFHDYWYSEDMSEILQLLMKRPEYVNNDMSLIGKHLSPVIYKKIQDMYVAKEIEKPKILNNLYGMEYGFVE